MTQLNHALLGRFASRAALATFAAITAQCIHRVYDEHDREDGGREITTTTTEKGAECQKTPQTSSR